MTIKDDSSSPKYQSSESARIVKRVPVDKKLDYIFVSPEDLKDLKELQLGGVTIDKPKILRYPDSGSDESLESPSKYTPYSREPEPYPVKGRNVASKYPSRPAPPLATHSVGDSSNEKDTGQDSPYLHKEYRAYAPPDAERYKVPIYENTPKTAGVNGDYSSAYGNNKPIDYPNPPSYTAPSGYVSSKPSAYTGYSGYSPPSNNYGRPNIQSYTGYANYRKPNYEPYLYYAAAKPLGYPLPPSPYSPVPYAPGKHSGYSGPSAYDIPKPGSYQNTPVYLNAKPNSYPEYSTYGNSRPSSHTGPTNYESSKPITYSGHPVKPSTYTKSSVYEPSKPGTSSHISSNPTVYSDTQSYDSPDESYAKSKPNGHSSSSTYSHPSKSYSSSKPSSYSRPSSYSSPATPHHDSSSERVYPGSEKYTSHPEDYDHPAKIHSYDEYNPSKIPSEVPEYEKHRHYSPKKSRKVYYDSPSVKHVSYDDLPNPYKHPSHESAYEHPNSESEEDVPHNYDSSSKPVSHDAYYQTPPKGKKYNSHPSYKNEDKIMYYPSYKPGSTYSSRPYDDSHPPGPGKSYGSLKTTYGAPYEPSSYEEPVNSRTKYRYPSSKVTYDSPYRDSHSTSPPLNDDYIDDANYKSSHYSSHDDVPPNYNSSPNYEYGSRYPISYRKTRHTDSKTPTSYFTLEDARSQDDGYKYERDPKPTITESHSHYQHYDDSSEVPDNHSVKKNYSPVRPAPLNDELYQPRYPPLPQRSKGDKTKEYYDEGESDIKDSSENYKPEQSVTAAKSYNPELYNNAYIRKKYYPSESQSKKKINSPSHDESHHHHFSDTSSEEVIEPIDYAKTSTVLYTKPNKDKTSTHAYSSDKSGKKTSHKSHTSNRSKKKGDILSDDFVGSQPEYSRIRQKDSYSSPVHFVHSFSYKSRGNGNDNTSRPESFSSQPKAFPQKRVPGVVHRSRHAYPAVKILRRQKGYLPYKPHYHKSIPAYDNKPYESIPSEVREENVTRDLIVYDIPKTISSKLSSRPHKKYKKYSTSESKSHSYDKNEKPSHHAIPGEPGRDYPVLKEIPYTQFSCEDKLPGFYADVESRCQV